MTLCCKRTCIFEPLHWKPCGGSLIYCNICLGHSFELKFDRKRWDLPVSQNQSKSPDPTAGSRDSSFSWLSFWTLSWISSFQMATSNEDWIFFRSDKVPHYAAHLPSRRTQSRIAWAVNIKQADPELHRQHLQSRQSALFALHNHVQWQVDNSLEISKISFRYLMIYELQLSWFVARKAELSLPRNAEKRWHWNRHSNAIAFQYKYIRNILCGWGVIKYP